MYYGGLMGYYFDPTWILVIIGAVLSMAASAKVNSTFNKYSKVRSMTGMTGEDAAKRLLNSQGIYDVTVRPVKGQLKTTTIRGRRPSIYRSRYSIPPLWRQSAWRLTSAAMPCRITWDTFP